LLGNVAAGQPIMAQEQVSDRVTIDRFFIGKTPSAEALGLVIKGDSMIEDGIYDGDYIFVGKQSTAENGEAVFVMTDGEATWKRIYDEVDRVRLQPANASMSPIYVHRSEFRSTDILGKVVGVYRKMH